MSFAKQKTKRSLILSKKLLKQLMPNKPPENTIKFGSNSPSFMRRMGSWTRLD